MEPFRLLYPPAVRLRYVARCCCAGVLIVLDLAAAAQGHDEPAPRGALEGALRFSTYLGGSGIEAGHAVAVDAEGNVYVAGGTASADFPGVRVPHHGGELLGLDVYVAKLSASGALVYATFLGGAGDEAATALAVDDRGRVYVAGGTTSPDFPATGGALHGYRGGPLLRSDGFLVRLGADGTTVEYATLLGGTGDDAVNGLALDGQGRVYLAGTTASADFPATPGAFQRALAGGLVLGADAFVVRLRPDGPEALALDYATFLGGAFDETGVAVAADAGGRAYVTGFTSSLDFPVQQPVQAAFAGPMRDLEGDAYVARLTADGSALDFSTYLGGRRDDQAAALALDAGGRVLVAGWTRSPDFPATPGAYQAERQGPEDAFLVKLSPEERRIVFATYLGGAGRDRALSVAVDAAGQAVLGGLTGSPDFPTAEALQPVHTGDAGDAFVARFDSLGGLPFSTFLGGHGLEAVAGLAVSRTGDACLTGGTGSGDYPVHQALQAVLRGASETVGVLASTFVTCLGEAGTGVSIEAPLDPPLASRLYPNYPNPFNPTTTIRFDVQRPGRVVLRVYDALGRRVATLVDADHAPGRYSVSVDAREWASGLYLYAIEMDGYRATRRMVLVK